MADGDSVLDFGTGEAAGGFGCGCGASGCAMLIGIVLFIGSFFLLFWNEGRAVRIDRALHEGGKTVLSIAEPAHVNPANEGKLVHISALADTSEVLSDPIYLVTEKAIRLHRRAETYQWTETAEQVQAEKTPGGGKKQATKYTYSKIWAEEIIDSGRFAQPQGHVNRFVGGELQRSWSTAATDVRIGGHTLPHDLASQIGPGERIPATPALHEKLPPEVRLKITVRDDYFYLGSPLTSREPEIGDGRISFIVVKPTVVSILAKQSKNSFEPYQTSNGTPLYRLENGPQSAESMFGKMAAENTALTWVLRLVGFIMMTIGMVLCFAPIAALGNLIPFVGEMVSGGIMAFSLGMSIILTLLTIAIGWITYRPWVAVPILVAVVVVGIGLYRLTAKPRDDREEVLGILGKSKKKKKKKKPLRTELDDTP